MTAYLLDTNVVSETTKARPEAAVTTFLAQNDPAYLSVVTLHELRFGIESLKDKQRRTTLQTWLDQLATQFAPRLLPVSAAIAERAGELRGHARRQGLTLHVEDALIAATALEHGMTVATRNTDDFKVAGVDCLNPWSPA